MKIKFKYVTLFLLLPSISFSQGIFKNGGNAIKNLVPEGYVFENAVIGDLNFDKKDDLVLIVRKGDELSFAIYFKIENDEFYEDQFNKVSENIIITNSIRHPNVEVYIYKNTLIFQTLYYTSSHPNHYFKFKLIDKSFVLIGYDYTWYSTHCHLYSFKSSYNFLTKKAQTIDQVYSLPENDEELNRCIQYSIPNELLEKLNKNNWNKKYGKLEKWKNFEWNTPIKIEGFNFLNSIDKIDTLWEK